MDWRLAFWIALPAALALMSALSGCATTASLWDGDPLPTYAETALELDAGQLPDPTDEVRAPTGVDPGETVALGGILMPTRIYLEVAYLAGVTLPEVRAQRDAMLAGWTADRAYADRALELAREDRDVWRSEAIAARVVLVVAVMVGAAAAVGAYELGAAP